MDFNNLSCGIHHLNLSEIQLYGLNPNNPISHYDGFTITIKHIVSNLYTIEKETNNDSQSNCNMPPELRNYILREYRQ